MNLYLSKLDILCKQIRLPTIDIKLSTTIYVFFLNSVVHLCC